MLVRVFYSTNSMKGNEEKKNFKTASMSRVRIVYIEVRYMKFKECNSTDDF